MTQKQDKKGQINQVFIFIIALLIIGAIALIGVRSIGGITKDKCTADLIIFQDSLAQIISNNNDYGSVNYERLQTPCKYHTLCLVDTRAITDEAISNGFSMEDTAPGAFLIKQSVNSKVEANAFLIGQDNEVQEVGYITQLQVETPNQPTCIRVKTGGYNLLLKGQGRTTLVSEKQ